MNRDLKPFLESGAFNPVLNNPENQRTDSPSNQKTEDKGWLAGLTVQDFPADGNKRAKSVQQNALPVRLFSSSQILQMQAQGCSQNCQQGISVKSGRQTRETPPDLPQPCNDGHDKPEHGEAKRKAGFPLTNEWLSHEAKSSGQPYAMRPAGVPVQVTFSGGHA